MRDIWERKRLALTHWRIKTFSYFEHEYSNESDPAPACLIVLDEKLDGFRFLEYIGGYVNCPDCEHIMLSCVL